MYKTVTLSYLYIKALSRLHVYKIKDMKNKEIDWNEMFKNIMERVEYPCVYFIEEVGTGCWLSDTADKASSLTKDPHEAMSFKGKQAKETAMLFLFLNQELGKMRNFIVTEHLFL